MSSPTPWTAGAVHAALEKHIYPVGKYIYLMEVRAARGFSPSAIADAIVVGLWPSRGHYPFGIEVKVSRSDWLSELKKVGKSDEIWRHCATWEVAAPEGIVKKEELPPGWGLIEVYPDDKPAKRVVKPKFRDDVLPLSGFVVSMLAAMHKDSESRINRIVHEKIARKEADSYREKAKLCEDLRVALNAAAQSKVDQALIDNLNYIIRESGIGRYELTNSPTYIVKKIKDALTKYAFLSDHQSLTNQLDRFAEEALRFKGILNEPVPTGGAAEYQSGDGDQVRSDQHPAGGRDVDGGVV